MTRYIVAIVLFITSSSYAQGLYGVHSPSGSDVWAVGKSGTVFHSTNGGTNWLTFNLGTTDLLTVCSQDSHVWIAGTSGTVYITHNNGGAWVETILPSAGRVNSLYFTSAQDGWAVGNSGKIWKTTDSGTSWDMIPSGTTQALPRVSFADAALGYAVTDSATLLKTTDGGLSWYQMVPVGWTSGLTSVSAKGPVVYVTGKDAFCRKSTDGGATWISLNFFTDTYSDVYDVFVWSEDTVYFTGGGGYLKFTHDGDTSYDWGIHQLHARTNDVFFYDGRTGWACSEKNNVILRTTDAGRNWQLPQGTVVNYSWSQKLSASNSTGSTYCVNPLRKDHIYSAMGNHIYRSVDFGDTWVQAATIPGSGSTRSFYIYPADTNRWTIAFAGASDVILHSTNRGQTWATALTRAFSSYGMPLEMDPDEPSHMLFGADGTGTGPDGVVYESNDFGATWDTLVQTSFRSPCDFVIVPGNNSIVLCADGVTGSGSAQMWRSTNKGATWASIYTNSGSEIPMISISRLRNNEAFATGWGSGGFRKTTDGGASWTQIATTSSTWGTDVCKDDPNAVIYGVYGGSSSYLSTNAGLSFATSSITGANSAFLFYDRSIILAQQTGGLFKYIISYTVPTTNAQTLTMVSPAGGEAWYYNTVHPIRWNASNLATVKIEFRPRADSAWQVIATVPAGNGELDWTVPNYQTTTAQIRISDMSDGTPIVTSPVFSILSASIVLSTTAIDFGTVPLGETRTDTVFIENLSNGNLIISNITFNTSVFIPNKTAMTVLPGTTDTVVVLFSPLEAVTYTDTMEIESNAPESPSLVFVSGTGQKVLGIANQSAPHEFALFQNYPNPFNPVTTIAYTLPKETYVTLRVYNVMGQEVAALVRQQQPLGRHEVVFSTANYANRMVSSGTYIYRLRAGKFTDTKKMLLIK